MAQTTTTSTAARLVNRGRGAGEPAVAGRIWHRRPGHCPLAAERGNAARPA